ETIAPGLAGQKGLRGEILLELKRSQPVTAQQLGELFKVSANAVRRHLKELQAEGLVHYGREQRGNGAPTFSYKLTAEGETLFPKQYESALKRLIDHVVSQEGKAAALSIIQQQYDDLRTKLGVGRQGETPMDRLKTVATVLENEGFMAESKLDGADISLSVHNCAIHAVADCLPEVCDTEIEFLQDVLGAEVKRETHIMNGCNACLYTVDFSKTGVRRDAGNGNA
ncbi:MAG: helix-turn-helix domain-containing protein, partial [Gemmatimonadota bacterium]|nr:helix-turn-helix domain-containing protein [Gemmatimonadota bacterium]